jgi:hypothetical protein
MPVLRLTRAADTMLPKLRIILVAVLATCAAALALSAGMVGARDPGDLTGVPEVSRTLVRQAIVAEPDRDQVQLLAYSRRADELLRLRDLPLTPARAVVDYAERAQARAAKTVAADAPAAASPTDSVTAPAAASEPAPAVVASVPAATADALAAPAADSAASATPPADAPPLATIAMAPVANPRGDTTAPTPVAQPASPPPRADTDTAPAPDAAPAETPAASAPSGDAMVAAVEPGASATTEMYGPAKPRTEGKNPQRRAKLARPHPPKQKKRAQVAADYARTAPATTPATGSPFNRPYNRNTGFGGRHYESTTRQRARPPTGG